MSVSDCLLKASGGELNEDLKILGDRLDQAYRDGNFREVKRGIIEAINRREAAMVSITKEANNTAKAFKAFLDDTSGVKGTSIKKINTYLNNTYNNMHRRQASYSSQFMEGLSGSEAKLMRDKPLQPALFALVHEKMGGKKALLKESPSPELNELADKIANHYKFLADERIRIGMDFVGVRGFTGSNHWDSSKIPDIKDKNVFIDDFNESIDWEATALNVGGIKDRREFLEEVWLNIKADKQGRDLISEESSNTSFRPGKTPKGKSYHRKLVFKDGLSEYNMVSKYASNNDMMDRVMSSSSRAAREVEFTLRLGSDSDTFKKFVRSYIKTTEKQKIKANQKPETFKDWAKALWKIDPESLNLDKLSEHFSSWEKRVDVLDGKWDGQANDMPAAARIFRDLIDFQPFAKLGGSTIVSIIDTATVRKTLDDAGYKFSERKGLAQALPFLAGSSDEELKSIARFMGMTQKRQLASLSRFMFQGAGESKLINNLNELMFLANGQHAMDNGNGQYMSDVLSMGFAERLQKDFKDLMPEDQIYFRDAGFNDVDWPILREAALHNETMSYFDPRMIRDLDEKTLKPYLDRKGWKNSKVNYNRAREELLNKTSAYFMDRRMNGIPTPSLAVKTAFTWGQKPGDFPNLMGRAVGTFKGFPAQILLNNMRRGANKENLGGAVLGTSALMAEMMLLGYVALSLKEAIKGRTPPDPMDPSTIGEVFMTAGAAGIAADFVVRGSSERPASIASSFLGPSIADLETGFKFTKQLFTNPDKAGDTLKKYVGSSGPFSLWYVKGIMNLTSQMATGQYGSYFTTEGQRKYAKTHYFNGDRDQRPLAELMGFDIRE